MRLTLSKKELAEGQIRNDKLQTAIEQINSNGYIIIDEVIPRDLTEQLHLAFESMLNEFNSRKGGKFKNKRVQIPLPFIDPYTDERVINNPIVIPILEQILGEDLRCIYFSSDTPMPGSDSQNVHCDVMPLFKNLPLALPSFAALVVIPLVDVDERNAPLEVWPGGTHLNPVSLGALDDSMNQHLQINRTAEHMLSEKLHMSAGSIMIRDIRMWHRGTANRSEHPRTNLTLIYSKSWYGYGSQIQIPDEAYKGLSEKARQIFRYEKIGSPVKMPWDR